MVRIDCNAMWMCRVHIVHPSRIFYHSFAFGPSLARILTNEEGSWLWSVGCEILHQTGYGNKSFFIRIHSSYSLFLWSLGPILFIIYYGRMVGSTYNVHSMDRFTSTMFNSSMNWWTNTKNVKYSYMIKNNSSKINVSEVCCVLFSLFENIVAISCCTRFSPMLPSPFSTFPLVLNFRSRYKFKTKIEFGKKQTGSVTGLYKEIIP